MLKINFRTHTEAFHPNARMEIARILRSVVADIDEGQSEGECVDGNGCTVGRWSYFQNAEQEAARAKPHK